MAGIFNYICLAGEVVTLPIKVKFPLSVGIFCKIGSGVLKGALQFQITEKIIGRGAASGSVLTHCYFLDILTKTKLVN